MSILADIKLSMRITHTALDDDIQRNIDACFQDLYRVGIHSISNADSLEYKAVELYCKWQYDYQGKGEQFQKNYEALRDALSLNKDHQPSEVV